MDIALPTFTYKTYRLDPNSPNFIFLAGKYAALSQLALATDPHSFGVAYSTEGALNPADYITRLKEPTRSLFVCVAHPENLPAASQAIEHGSWIGMVTQIGPTAKEKYWLPEAGAPEPLSDDLETKWHQTGTWIDPAHRGKGIAKQMVEAAVTYVASSMTGSVTQVRVRAFTGPDNELSKGMYGSRGFPVVGKITIRESMVANGNIMYPFHGRSDWSDEVLDWRVGLVMERVVKKEHSEN